MRISNTNYLTCIHLGCPVIPTVFLQFEDGLSILGKMLACPDHKEEGIEAGRDKFKPENIIIREHPYWLNNVYNIILENGSDDDGILYNSTDIERLKIFVATPRNSGELK